MTAVFAAAREHGAALLATPVTDTIKRAGDDRFTIETVPRHDLTWPRRPRSSAATGSSKPTPGAASSRRGATDDTQLVEALGHRCAIVEGSPLNLKITTQDDLRLAGAILRVRERTIAAFRGHPFADESAMWDDSPKLKPSDLF